MGALVLLVASCGESSNLSEEAGVGPSPNLPEPQVDADSDHQHRAAKGWPRDAKPKPAGDLAVNAFASELDHPRWLYVLPNGDVLVAETNAPPNGRSGTAASRAGSSRRRMKRAGAGVPSANRITLLRDADGDGVAETRTGLPRRT